MTPRWVIGLASGECAEGLDAALLGLEGCGLGMRARVEQSLHYPLADDLGALTNRMARGPCDARDVSLLHRLLGETFAALARQIADRASLSLQKVQCIDCSGHAGWSDADGRFPSALNLGMAAVVAERTGLTTASDFGARDLAAGGLGVRLGGLPDYVMLREYRSDEDRLLVHLGTIAHVVSLPRRCRVQEIAAFEAGPCNLLLSALMRNLTSGHEEFDSGGKAAVQGRCLEPLLERWLSHPFVQRRPPRAVPRHVFGHAFALEAIEQARAQHWNAYDLLCTATHFVVRVLVLAIRQFVPMSKIPPCILLSGGGARNGLMRHLLGQQLGTGLVVEQTDAAGIPFRAREAIAAGLLAALGLDGVPANLPQVTGAAGSRLLGSLTPGSASNWARCLAWMTQQATASGAVQAA